MLYPIDARYDLELWKSDAASPPGRNNWLHHRSCRADSRRPRRYFTVLIERMAKIHVNHKKHLTQSGEGA